MPYEQIPLLSLSNTDPLVNARLMRETLISHALITLGVELLADLGTLRLAHKPDLDPPGNWDVVRWLSTPNGALAGLVAADVLGYAVFTSVMSGAVEAVWAQVVALLVVAVVSCVPAIAASRHGTWQDTTATDYARVTQRALWFNLTVYGAACFYASALYSPNAGGAPAFIVVFLLQPLCSAYVLLSLPVQPPAPLRRTLWFYVFFLPALLAAAIANWPDWGPSHALYRRVISALAFWDAVLLLGMMTYEMLNDGL